MSLASIKKCNPEIIIHTPKADAFKPYGRLIENFDFNDIFHFAELNIKVPKEGVEYFASVPELERFDIINTIQDYIYGQMPVEVGSCAGQNTQLIGVEYHQGSETILAVMDCIIILGRQQDIENNTFDTMLMEYFFLHAGECVELYSTTLHYVPCQTTERGFAIICILPRGTNTKCVQSGNPNLVMLNKFFIAHSLHVNVNSYEALVRLSGPIPKIRLW